MVTNERFIRPASSGEGDIFSQIWAPEPPVQPKAVLQIAHGMAEYSDRYAGFAGFMAGHGCVVCANDHAGHGTHAKVKGYFAEKDGWECLLKDMKSLMDLASARYEGLPCFLLGHSMGSFLARSYVTRYEGLRGVILSGTAGANPLLRAGLLIAALQKRFKGAESKGKLLSMLTLGSYNKRISNPVNKVAWTSSADEVSIAYKADPLCGFCFTAGGFYDMYTGVREVSGPAWARNVPEKLSIYMFSGGEDPVGAYGRGPAQVLAWLKDSGHEDLSMKIYQGGRHEMLNEVNKYEVYEDVLAWLEKRL